MQTGVQEVPPSKQVLRLMEGCKGSPLVFGELPTDFEEQMAHNPDVALGELLRLSQICRDLHYHGYGTWRFLDYVYGIVEAKLGGVDAKLSGSLSGQALRDRLEFVSRLAANWLRDRLVTDTVRVIDFGAGPAPYAIEAIKQLPPDLRPRLLWNCLDLDGEAMRIGEERAREEGFKRYIHLHEADFLASKSYPTDDRELADFGLMIGILCGMTPEQSVRCLQKVKPYFKPKGELVAATLLQRAFDEDQDTFRVLCGYLGWQLRPKTEEKVMDIFQNAGWEIIQILSERPGGKGQYAVVHARIA